MDSQLSVGDPQSHWARARTDDQWLASTPFGTVHGRRKWFASTHETLDVELQHRKDLPVHVDAVHDRGGIPAHGVVALDPAVPVACGRMCSLMGALSPSLSSRGYIVYFVAFAVAIVAMYYALFCRSKGRRGRVHRDARHGVAVRSGGP